MTEAATPPEQPNRTWSPARRAAAEERKRRRATAPASNRPDSELIAEDVVAEAVANITTLAGFAMPIAPYTAVTIAGVPGEREGEWVVRSRAEMAGAVLLEHAKRNPRVLAAIARFNLMFKNVELVEVVAGVTAAGAVDARLIPPDATIALPGGMQVPILAPAIGDTLAYMAQAEPEVAAARSVPRTPPPARDEPAGPGEPFYAPEPGEGEPMEVPLGPQTRARLIERERRINNGEEPTLRREGQSVARGGVEGT